MASETGSARVRSANSLALSVLEAPGPFQEKLGFFGAGGGEKLVWKEIGGSARMISGTPISEALLGPRI